MGSGLIANSCILNTFKAAFIFITHFIVTKFNVQISFYSMMHKWIFMEQNLRHVPPIGLLKYSMSKMDNKHLSVIWGGKSTNGKRSL